MEEVVLKPEKAQGTRWIDHKVRALKKMKSNWSLIVSHLESFHENTKNKDQDRAKAKGYLLKLKRLKFLWYMHFMLDLLNEIAKLSLLMQRDDVTVSQVVKKVEIVCSEIYILLNGNGDNLTEFYETLIDDKYQNQIVSRVGVPPNFDNTEKAHITRGMTENIRNRFQNLHQDNRFSSCIVLDQRNWPAEKDNLLTYGNRQIKTIYNSFEALLQRIGCDINNALDEWKEMKIHINSNDHLKNLHPLNLWQRLTNEDGNREVKEHSNILKIILLTEVYPLSTAVCERIFCDEENKIGLAK